MSNQAPNLQRITGDLLTGDWDKDRGRMMSLLSKFMGQSVDTLQGNVQLGAQLGCDLKTISVKTPASDWTAPDLQNSWANFLAGTTDPGFRKDGWGNVWVRGAVAGGTANSTIFTLPADFRPAQDHNIAATSGAAGVCQLRVHYDTGDVDQMHSVGTAFLAIDMAFPSANSTPGVLSCFPLQVRTSNMSVSGVVVMDAMETDTPSKPSAAVGNCAWSFDGGNMLTVTNIPGLALNRNYSITLAVFP